MVRSRFRVVRDAFQAIRIFTDREVPKRTFQKVVQNPNRKEPFVLSYYGVGGIGKTRLCQELRSSLESMDLGSYSAPLIDLAVAECREQTEALLYIRRNLDFPCYTFEFAFTRYWAMLGRPLTDLTSKFREIDSGLLNDILGYGRDAGADLLSAGSFVPGASLLLKLAKSARKKWARWTHSRREILDEMDELELSDLQERLTYYLGIDVADAFESGHRTILFIDSFEHLWLNQRAEIRPRDTLSDQWIRDLLAPASGSVAVIFSRLKLEWDKIQGENWQDCLEEHLLGELAPEDCEAFLTLVPIEEAELRAHITSISGGLPFLLDLCVNIYEIHKQKGRLPTPEDFGGTERQVIENSLRNLSLSERETVRLLSIPSEFDRSLFRFLVRSFGLDYPQTAFDILCGYSFVQECEAGRRYRIHDVMRSHIVASLPEDLRRDCSGAIISYFRSRERTDILSHLEAFRQVGSLVLPEDTETLDWLLTVARELLDTGYWNELRSVLERRREDQPFESLPQISLIRGVVERRLGDVREARKCLETVDWRALRQSNRDYGWFEYADTVRLTGEFTKSMTLYRDVSRKAADDSIVKGRAIRQYADVLMLKGRFRKSVELLKGQLDRDANDVQRAGTLRQLGHNYRFNLEFEDARQAYLSALEKAHMEGQIGLTGKLYTNLVELKVYEMMGRDLEAEDKAVEVNFELGNKVEAGKALAARGMTRILVDGDLEGGWTDFEAAGVLHNKTGYAGGKLVLLSYEAIARIISGELEETQRILTSLIEGTMRAEVYGFLLVPFRRWGQLRIQRGSSERVHWLDPQQVEKNWKNVKRRTEEMMSKVFPSEKMEVK